MAFVIQPTGLTTISDAETTTGWASDGDTPAQTGDIQREGSFCIGAQFSIETGSLYFTFSALNLTNKRIYCWNRIHTRVLDKANRGVMILLSDGTNRRGYAVGGSDDPGFDIGAWNCYVLDTANLPTLVHNFAGTAAPTLTAITSIGMGWVCPSMAAGNTDNMFVDIMRICEPSGGLRLLGGNSGSTAGTFAAIAADDFSTDAGKAYGHIRQLQPGIFGLQGNLLFGDPTGSQGLYFDASDSVVVLEDHRHQTGSGLPFRISIEAGTSRSFFQTGDAVGSGDTQVGAAGVQIRSANTASRFDFIANDSGTLEVRQYGFSFLAVRSGSAVAMKFPTGAFAIASYSLSGGTFDQCGGVDVGQVPVRNCVFSGHAVSGSGALLWTAVTDLKNCSFLNNTAAPVGFTSSAIITRVTGSYQFDGHTYAGNQYDLINASNGSFTASVVGGGDTPTVLNIGAGSETQIVAQTQVTLTGLVSQSQVIVLDTDDGSPIANVEDVGVTGEFSFSDTPGNIVDIFIHAVDYVWYSITDFTIPSSDTELPVVQQFDRNYSNPA